MSPHASPQLLRTIQYSSSLLYPTNCKQQQQTGKQPTHRKKEEHRVSKRSDDGKGTAKQGMKTSSIVAAGAYLNAVVEVYRVAIDKD